MTRPYFQRTHGFQEAFLHGAPDTHNFSRSLHLRAQHVGRGGEFVKGKSRYFGYHIVKSRLEARGSVCKHYFVETHTHRYFCGHARNGVSARLACQSRRTGNSRIYLYQKIVEGLRVQRELYVAAALYFQRPYDFERAVSQKLIFLVCKRLTWRDHYAVARVYSHRVEVFHIADGYRRVVRVADNLVLYFLEASNALFHKHLSDGRKAQRVFHNFSQLLLVVRKAAARAPKGECGTQHDGIPYFFRSGNSLFRGVRNHAWQHRLAQTLAQLLELFSVLGALYALRGGAQKLHLTLA